MKNHSDTACAKLLTKSAGGAGRFSITGNAITSELFREGIFKDGSP